MLGTAGTRRIILQCSVNNARLAGGQTRCETNSRLRFLRPLLLLQLRLPPGPPTDFQNYGEAYGTAVNPDV